VERQAFDDRIVIRISVLTTRVVGASRQWHRIGKTNSSRGSLSFQRHTFTKFAAPSHSSSSMTVVSDDPSWWPWIISWRISSYYVGSWQLNVETDVPVSPQVRFAVAASVGVTYDWGKHDTIEEVLITYIYFKHLHLVKRYADVTTRAAISLRKVL
jgi:hypothetical protein